MKKILLGLKPNTLVQDGNVYIHFIGNQYLLFTVRPKGVYYENAYDHTNIDEITNRISYLNYKVNRESGKTL